MSKKIIKGFTPVVDSVSKPKFTTGFTLLEILLVVGIIAILAGIVIVAINPSRQLAAARDTERRSDLKQINNALLQYYIDNQKFPDSVVSDTLTEICNSGSGDGSDCPVGSINLSALVPKYISAIPADPKGSTATTTGYHIALNSSHKLYLKAPSTEISQTYIAIGSGTGVIELGSGTIASPFLIYNCTGLQNIKDAPSANFALANNIDCSTTTSWNGGAGFEPVAFSGSIDGKNNTVSNLYINRPLQNNVGLFASSNGTISNLGLLAVDITGSVYIGGLAGSFSGTIANSFSTGEVSGQNDVGGLVGFMNGSGTISNSYSSVIVSGADAEIGGLVGLIYGGSGVVTQSHATGNVSGSHDVGGLVGTSDAAISKSYATGNISGSYAGGLVGSQMTGIISDSYATGNVNGHTQVGGLVGLQSSGYANPATVSRSYSIGRVTTSWVGYPAGGLVGLSESQVVADSYYDRNTSERSDNDTRGIPKTTSEMKNQSTFSGWDFTNIWAMSGSVNGGYPYLR